MCIDSVYEVKESFKCDICVADFVHKHNLNQHIRKNHEQKKPSNFDTRVNYKPKPKSHIPTYLYTYSKEQNKPTI